MSGILDKYKDLTNTFDREASNEIHIRISGMSLPELEKIEVGSPGTVLGDGRVLLVSATDRKSPVILEMVVSDKDAVSNLYLPHPIFNSRQDYIAARSELIDLVNDFADAPIFGATIERCPLRNRPVNVRELGIRQLLEIVRAQVAKRS